MTDADLVAHARAAALRAHAPYSGFAVGCAIAGADGAVVVAANMENACYRLGQCAETGALAAAMQAFGLARVARIAVAGGRVADGALTGAAIVTPCGGCRQAIGEAAAVAGRDIAIVCANGDGDAIVVRTIAALLPDAFGPAALDGAG